MLDAVFKFIETLKVKFNDINIGFNKKENKVIIDNLDQSKHLHYHAEIGLSPEEIIKLSNEDVGKLVRQQAFLQLKATSQDCPEGMRKLEAIYTASAITTGTAIITVKNLAAHDQLMSSGDFIKQLPIAINGLTIPFEEKPNSGDS